MNFFDFVDFFEICIGLLGVLSISGLTSMIAFDWFKTWNFRVHLKYVQLWLNFSLLLINPIQSQFCPQLARLVKFGIS